MHPIIIYPRPVLLRASLRPRLTVLQITGLCIAFMIFGAVIGTVGVAVIVAEHNNTHDQPAPDMVPAADVPPLPEPDRGEQGLII